MSQKDKENLTNTAKMGKKIDDSPVPNGELKWSIDEESSDDTETNLMPKIKKDSISDDSQKDAKSDKEESKGKQTKNKSNKKTKAKSRDKKKLAHKSSQTSEEHDLDLSSKEASVATNKVEKNTNQKPLKDTSGREEKEYTFEDTMGPIDFKEYSLEPDKTKQASQKTRYDKEESPNVIGATVKEESKPFVFSKTENKDKQSGSQKAKTPQKKHTRDSIKSQKVSIPKWKWALKILWLPITLVLVLLIGLMIGHSTIGEQPAGGIFDIEIWTHLYKLIFTK